MSTRQPVGRKIYAPDPSARGPLRILIFLLGSLGDTIVALPSLHLIARRFPHSERRVLNHTGVSAKAAPMSELLHGSGLVHGYFEFSIGGGKADPAWQLIRAVRRWAPDLVVHLHEPRGRAAALRDWIFFRLCGARATVGIPLTRDLQEYMPKHGLYEHRAQQLARRLACLGDAAIDDRASWSIELSSDEYSMAGTALAPLSGSAGILAMSIGAKIDVKDWGAERWASLLRTAGAELRHWGVVALGAAVERDATENVLAAWPGPRLNLCGQTTVRGSAALIARCDAFVGHDSGPMHLAASVGTPCVAVFSARSKAGIWYPYGPGHRILRRRPPCENCELAVCVERAKQCITDIRVDEVAAAVIEIALRRHRHEPVGANA